MSRDIQSNTWRWVNKSMTRTRYAGILCALFVGLVFMLALATAPAHSLSPEDIGLEPFPEHTPMDCAVDGYYTMKDIDTEAVILLTARRLFPGNEYIDQHNILYRVEDVEEGVGWARQLGEVQLSDPPEDAQVLRSALQGSLAAVGEGAQDDEQERQITVAIYHSHGAESYVPSDGEEFIEEGGGILIVGERLADALEEMGVNVLFSRETHVPHDAGAYHRSRRTVEELMKQGADVFVDVHRDAVPAHTYKTEINGDTVVQLQFVVGQQNPNSAAIREFAESMKAKVDQRYPGLVKGIFMARGNYNQDMFPMALLIEVGTHETTREGAEEAVAMYAESVRNYFLGPPEAAAGEEGADLQRTAGRSILWVVLLALIAVAVYLVISTRDLEELKAKVARFFRGEFLDLTGRRKDE